MGKGKLSGCPLFYLTGYVSIWLCLLACHGRWLQNTRQIKWFFIPLNIASGCRNWTLEFLLCLSDIVQLERIKPIRNSIYCILRHCRHCTAMRGASVMPAVASCARRDRHGSWYACHKRPSTYLPENWNTLLLYGVIFILLIFSLQCYHIISVVLWNK